MKLFAATMLSLLTIPSYAQGLLKTLDGFQQKLPPQEKVSVTTASGSLEKMSPILKTKSSGVCSQQDQTSLPLQYITKMMMVENGQLNLRHDSRSGKISISSPKMISNCEAMIEWVPRETRSVDGRKIYAVEAKIKKGESCEGDICTYQVAKVEKGVFQKFEPVKVKATVAGFESCLEKSGVVKGGEVAVDAIFPSAVGETFEGYNDSGDVLYVSRGPISRMVGAKYGEYVEVDGCDHYEKITPDGIAIRSLQEELQEADAANYAAEFEKIKNCNDYGMISDFIEKYSQAADEFNAIRDRIVQDSFKAIASGKYSDEDLETVAEFGKYTVKPLVDSIGFAYDQAMKLDGQERAAMLDNIKDLQAKLVKYNSAPFLTAAIVKKLEADGRFTEAAQANNAKALMVSHARVGAKQGGIIITPGVAAQNAANLQAAYEKKIEVMQEHHEIRTGQTLGNCDPTQQIPCSKVYFELASRMNQNIQIRSQNYNQEIAVEYARMQQPSGFCFRSPFRNVQKCIQKSMIRIQELQAQLAHYNKVDAQRAAEYGAKAQEYAKLEKEGATYIARQNGEEVPVTAEDTTMPTPRSADEEAQSQAAAHIDPQTWVNPYTGQQHMQGGVAPYQPNNMFNPQYAQGQQPQQGYNPYPQQGYNPYASQGYQQPFMGQDNYSGQFNMGAQYGYNNQSYLPMNQQQQYGYNYNLSAGQQYALYPQQPPMQHHNPYAQQMHHYGMPQNMGNQYQMSSQYNMYAR